VLADYDTFNIDGLQIHIRRQLRTGAPKLLLTGAWPQSIHCWDGAWDRLSAHFDLLAVDLPGFGRSEGRAALMCPSAQGAFLARIVEHVGFEGCHAVMPDVGVPIALWLLANQPAVLAGATLSNGPASAAPALAGGLDLLLTSRFVRRSACASSDAFVAIALYRGYQRFTPSAALRATYLDCYRRGRLAATMEYLASYPRELPAIDARLTEITQPVHIVWGDRDPFLRTENAHRLAARLARCTLEILPGVGHFSHEDASEHFVRGLAAA